MTSQNLTGMILRDKELGEKDKVIKIFTAERGIISAIVRCGQSVKSRNGAIAQPLTYCNFSLFEKKNGFIVDKIEIQELFWGIRKNLESLSLAQYFCELCMAWVPDENNSGRLLRLLLNTLYYLSIGKKSNEFLKSIFEFRGCALCGYMPDLVCCSRCKKFDSSGMAFWIKDATLWCKDCTAGEEKFIYERLSSGVLSAMRHIIYANLEQLFKFSISRESEKQLSIISEKYILEHMGVRFKSLEFYKKLTIFSK